MLEFTDKDREFILNTLTKVGLQTSQITDIQSEDDERLEYQWIEVEFDHSIILMKYNKAVHNLMSNKVEYVIEYQIGVIHSYPGSFYEPPDQETVYDNDSSTGLLAEAVAQLAHKILDMRLQDHFDALLD
jgi:hypothetical protein